MWVLLLWGEVDTNFGAFSNPPRAQREKLERGKLDHKSVVIFEKVNVRRR